jgi:coenzyme F420 biosynthesis associated uncharacterized protein
MIDWSIARTIARVAAGGDGPASSDIDVVAFCAEMEPHVLEYTGLELDGARPPAELLTRADWTEPNIESLGHMLDPVAARLEERLSFAGPLAGALRLGASATLAAEVGLVTGYLSHRVLGQYDVSLLAGDVPPRLLFVGPNLDKAVGDLEVDAAAFGRWVCAHELTHVHQFGGVSWLREHMSGLLREYLSTLEVRIERGTAGGLPSIPDPAKIVEAFREGGLAALVQSEEQQVLMDRIQAAMAVIEGYSEHVMDVIGERAIPGHEKLRAAMDERRRNRSAPARVIERLLGFDVKLRQYELGKRFADAVVADAGIDGLNRVWREPAALPTLPELDDAGGWLRRTGADGRAAA